MLRTIFMIGLFALAGLFVLKFFFGILPGILGLIAVHPKDNTRMVQLVAISASRGNTKRASSP